MVELPCKLFTKAKLEVWGYLESARIRIQKIFSNFRKMPKAPVVQTGALRFVLTQTKQGSTTFRCSFSLHVRVQERLNLYS
ncbi:MAG: hypothetical protein COV44_03405 [Deltaproteobacteria bacterium CG11_big_fil_rev_8_21_14_0_20_45_16]|nr:MAG: hypothetical protein COV44_03405 [Deltaproteobacteria bacterium CG11_big_fil_rev_8_21_14_0_20_45_16]